MDLAILENVTVLMDMRGSTVLKVCVLFCAATMVNMEEDCVTAKKAGREPSVTFRSMTARWLTARGMASVWREAVSAMLVGRALPAILLIAQSRNVQDMERVWRENATAKLDGKE